MLDPRIEVPEGRQPTKRRRRFSNTGFMFRPAGSACRHRLKRHPGAIRSSTVPSPASKPNRDHWPAHPDPHVRRTPPTPAWVPRLAVFTDRFFQLPGLTPDRSPVRLAVSRGSLRRASLRTSSSTPMPGTEAPARSRATGSCDRHPPARDRTPDRAERENSPRTETDGVLHSSVRQRDGKQPVRGLTPESFPGPLPCMQREAPPFRFGRSHARHLATRRSQEARRNLKWASRERALHPRARPRTA